MPSRETVSIAFFKFLSSNNFYVQDKLGPVVMSSLRANVCTALCWSYMNLAYDIDASSRRCSMSSDVRWSTDAGQAVLTPRTAGGLSHHRTAGGGGGHICAPPANSKTTQRIDKRKKKTLDKSQQALEKVPRWFLCEVKIEVTRPSRAKFSQISELHDMVSYYAHYLGPCNSYIKI